MDSVAPYKLMEKLVFEQLQSHLQLHGIGDTFQSGFRSRHSTESALLRVHNDILGALDGKSSGVLVLLVSNMLLDIKQWLSQNFLHLNEVKTEYILFSPDSPSSSLNFGPLTPQFAPTVRNPGVKSMHFDKQISAVVKVNDQMCLRWKIASGIAVMCGRESTCGCKGQ
ncbi:uncharacterized protein LOC116685831, partial [Tachysurus ichikawai]